MSSSDCIPALGGWEGYTPNKVWRDLSCRHARIFIELIPIPSRAMRCTGCGESVDRVRETTRRWTRDLPVLDADTFLIVSRRRLLCPRCGPCLEELPWLERYARVTTRLAESVARLCQWLSVKHAASFFHLSWDQPFMGKYAYRGPGSSLPVSESNEKQFAEVAYLRKVFTIRTSLSANLSVRR